MSLFEKVYKLHLRSKIKNKDFTIISNNCWGGGVYEDLNLEYKTPTIGLFFYAPCYIKFLKNMQFYIDTQITFKNDSFYSECNTKKNIDYPIGVIHDIEIHFLHYATEQEAYEKWNRRKQRVNFNNIFISFSDRDFCSYDLLTEFDKISYQNKIVFSAKPYPQIKSLIWLKKYKKEPWIGDIYTDKWGYRRYFDVIRWLNKY